MSTLETGDDPSAQLEWIAALPHLIQCAGTTALAVEDALSPALPGHGKASCSHVVDAETQRGGDRTPVLCLRHPDRLLCDTPGSSVGSGCAGGHLTGEHADEPRPTCLVCELPTEQPTPVFAIVRLHEPLPVRTAADGRYEYTGELRTLPVAHLCPRHAPVFRRPWVLHWPMGAEHRAPDDATRRDS